MNRSAVLTLATFKGVNPIEPDPKSTLAKWLMIRERCRMTAGVPFLAIDRTGVAPDAGVEINDQPEFLTRSVPRNRRHLPVSPLVFFENIRP